MVIRSSLSGRHQKTLSRTISGNMFMRLGNGDDRGRPDSPEKRKLLYTRRQGGDGTLCAPNPYIKR